MFPSIRTPLKPISENTLNAGLRRLGYAKEEMTAHGFRSVASTLLNESGEWSSDAIERALAHMDKNAVRSAYHRGPHWKERFEMAQWWADYLDTLRTGAGVVAFLATYKVIKVHVDRDIQGHRPQAGHLDRDGNEIEDRIYNTRDFDRTLVLDDRTKLVARKVTEFLKESGDRYQKTIVFCVDQEHAARMAQALINENADLVAENSRYVMRITGNDPEGQAQLGNFIDPESRYPVLVTISRLLSMGVDAQTCRLIVLDRDVGSMTEFKQIVGRGTRVH